MMAPTVRVLPADWPLCDQLAPLAVTAVERLELTERIATLTLILDALAADDRPWFRLDGGGSPWRLAIWLHPDQVLRDRPRPQSPATVWEMAPPVAEPLPPAATDFSLPNAQRFLYQQLLLVRDLLDGAVTPSAVPAELSEAFQEAWLVTVDGRLQRLGLPHQSAAEHRLRFLHVFAPAGVLTPGHWSVFNQLWDGGLADQPAVLAKVRQLPSLGRRPRL
jgi:hypothetical protein